MVNDKKQALINELISVNGTNVNRAMLLEAEKKHGISAGFLTVNKIGRGLYDISKFVSVGKDVPSQTTKVLSDEEILQSQRKRFGTLARMTDGVISGNVRSMIVSGPAGVGKTYQIEGSLELAANEEEIKYTKVSGFIRATGLYKLLWEHRDENEVVLLDDADSAFQDEVALNLLKAALDTSKRREISWRSEKEFLDEEGEAIPNNFEFKGSVIFITNLNFERMIEQGNRLAPHFAALISRSFYIDLNLGSSREYLVRIKDVLQNTDMAYTLGLKEKQAVELMQFIEENHNKLRELSLRIVSKLAKVMLFTKDMDDFRNVAETTCFKNRY